MKRGRRRKYSQYLLNSPKIAQRIVAGADIQDQTVVEIGPGRGSLTQFIAEKAQRVIAIEIDPQMIEELKIRSLPNVTIVHDDFLQHDISQYGSVNIVGTIPYAISSAIIEKFVVSYAFIKRAVIVVQREFAQRIVAKPGTGKYGSLTVCVNYVFNAKKLFTIPARFFTPQPSISSVAILLKRKDDHSNICDETAFFDFVKKIFHYPRKSIRNAFLQAVGAEPLDCKDARLQLRPAQLTVQDFVELYNGYCQ
jgi:16S rRNA (adenine1518-N6/adenine1519-N6)-dimethyltransferase